MAQGQRVWSGSQKVCRLLEDFDGSRSGSENSMYDIVDQGTQLVLAWSNEPLIRMHL